MRAVRRYLGAFLAELGGLDVLSFSGGIGESSASAREAVYTGLTGLGVELNRTRNAAAEGEAVPSHKGASVRVLLIPASEEQVVARAVAEVLAAAGW